MIEIKALNVSYGDHRVLSDLNMTFGDGITCLMGESGCGKTTLLHVLAGLIPVNAGEISGLPEHPVIMFQEDRLIPGLSVYDNIALVTEGPEGADRALYYMEKVGLKEARDMLPGELSGGMSRRVALARALAAEGGLLLLDEPFKGLNPELVSQMAELIRACSVPVIVTTHDVRDADILAAKEIARIRKCD